MYIHILLMIRLLLSPKEQPNFLVRVREMDDDSVWARCRKNMSYSGKDKGGPSKGGFLYNRLFSWMIYYLYTHTIVLITQV